MMHLSQRERWRWTVDFDVPAQFRESRRLDAYWRSVRQRTGRSGRGALPDREALGGAALGPYVRNLFTVVQVPETAGVTVPARRSDEADFAFATVGSAILSAFGLEAGLGTVATLAVAANSADPQPSPRAVGAPIETLFDGPEEAEAARRLYRLVLQRGRPMVAAGQVQAAGGAWATFEAVQLPVADRRHGPMILGGLFLIDSVDDGL